MLIGISLIIWLSRIDPSVVIISSPVVHVCYCYTVLSLSRSCHWRGQTLNIKTKVSMGEKHTMMFVHDFSNAATSKITVYRVTARIITVQNCYDICKLQIRPRTVMTPKDYKWESTADDTTYIKHRTWRNQATNDLKASSLRTISHSIWRYHANAKADNQ